MDEHTWISREAAPSRISAHREQCSGLCMTGPLPDGSVGDQLSCLHRQSLRDLAKH